MISLNIKRRRTQPIGLDIGTDSVKMIQFVIDKGHIRVRAADKRVLEAGSSDDAISRRSAVSTAIEEMMQENDFKGNRVVSCLSNDELKVRSLRLSDREGKDLDELVKKEVGLRFGIDPDMDSINYIVAGDVRQGEGYKKELILFTSTHNTISGHIELLDDCGLRPVAIDTVPSALYRNFERFYRRQEDRERTVVFVDVGVRYTTVVFGKFGEMTFVKQIPIGVRNFDDQIAGRLGIKESEARGLRLRQNQRQRVAVGAAVGEGGSSEKLSTSMGEVVAEAVSSVAEELAKEMSLCLRYYTVTFRGKRVEQTLFAGGGAYEGGLLKVLQRQLPVEVEVVSPLRGFDLTDMQCEDDRRGLLCEWAVATGLGLKGWDRIRKEVKV